MSTRCIRILLGTVLIITALLANANAQTQNWDLVSPTGNAPVARRSHRMVYDSTHGRMVLFGGGSASGYLNDIWEFDVATKTWTNVTPSSGPTPVPRGWPAMAHDPVRNKILMYGGAAASGQVGDTWEWDTGNRSWTFKPADSLGNRVGSGMAFDPNRNQIVLFSGRHIFNRGHQSTYAWDGNNWVDISPLNSPSGRAFHMMATDMAALRIVLFGGWNGGQLQDTWEWNGNTWTEIITPIKPFNREAAGMSYDSERGVMVLFGGNPGYPPPDTWTFDGQNWTQQQPCDSPPSRSELTMAYDPVRKRHVMFGGVGGIVVNNDTWFYGAGLGSLPCGDANAPVTVANSTVPNAAGWNNSDVNILLEASDGEDGSGVQDITYSATGTQSISQTTVSGASANFIITAEGETVISYFATDNAGNTEAAQTLIIKIDKLAPSVACGSADAAWHANDVSIPCTANDGVSGLADSGDGSFNLTTSVQANTETASASTDSRTVCDVADNCATAGPVSGNKIDKKAPTITITTPSTSAVYLLNQAVAANFTCNDGGSGVGTCAGPVAHGSNIDTASAGSKTFTVNATDQVGNTAAPQSVSYSVGYGVVALYDQTKVHKSGSTVPIKIQIVDANGVNYSSASSLVQAISVTLISANSAGTPEDAGNSNPDLNFRYDASLGGYIFNLQTTGYAAGTYELHFVVAGDTTDHVVQFRIRP